MGGAIQAAGASPTPCHGSNSVRSHGSTNRRAIPGDRVRTLDGAVAEILDETQVGQWIKVRYIESDEDPEIVGTEDLCHHDELPNLAGGGRLVGSKAERPGRGSSASSREIDVCFK